MLGDKSIGALRNVNVKTKKVKWLWVTKQKIF
jgi:hypothetical protein